jgi:hypothetical protein
MLKSYRNRYLRKNSKKKNMQKAYRLEVQVQTENSMPQKIHLKKRFFLLFCTFLLRQTHNHEKQEQKNI